jgi:hypothetical protein
MEADNAPNARPGDDTGADFSAQLNRSIQELHHLVEVYHDHGHADEAQEIYLAIIRIRGRMGDQSNSTGPPSR